jgi:hypothetical protein
MVHRIRDADSCLFSKNLVGHDRAIREMNGKRWHRSLSIIWLSGLISLITFTLSAGDDLHSCNQYVWSTYWNSGSVLVNMGNWDVDVS